MGSGARDLFVRDATIHAQMNKDLLNYPTFVYEKGKVYPDEIQYVLTEEDPSEKFVHENTTPKSILNPSDESDEGLDL